MRTVVDHDRVLDLWAAGWHKHAIADLLTLSPNTVTGTVSRARVRGDVRAAPRTERNGALTKPLNRDAEPIELLRGDWSDKWYLEMNAVFCAAMSAAIELGLEKLPEVVKDDRPIAFRQIHTVGQMYQQGALASVIGE